MRFVLDATAFRSGMSLPGEHEFFVPEKVVEEVRLGRTARDLELQKELGLKAREPGEEYVAEIRRAAGDTGDTFRLSEADIEVLALALELDATIITDDYSVQNCARAAGIRFKPGVIDGIVEVYHWEHRCSGCGKTYDRKLNVCDVCGSPVKTKRKR